MNVVFRMLNPLGIAFVVILAPLLSTRPLGSVFNILPQVAAFTLRYTNTSKPLSFPNRRILPEFAKPETIERLCKILERKFGQEAKNVDPSCKFLQEFDADQLDEVEVLLSIEEEFDLTIPDYDFAELRTIKEIADYLERKLERRQDI